MRLIEVDVTTRVILIYRVYNVARKGERVICTRHSDGVHPH